MFYYFVLIRRSNRNVNLKQWNLKEKFEQENEETKIIKFKIKMTILRTVEFCMGSVWNVLSSLPEFNLWKQQYSSMIPDFFLVQYKLILTRNFGREFTKINNQCNRDSQQCQNIWAVLYKRKSLFPRYSVP